MKLTGKNVMVTGGAGFIGSHLLDRITEENPANLIVVDSFFLGNERNLTETRRACPDLKLYRMDASNLAAIGDQDYALHNTIISHDDGDFACIAGGVYISGDVQIGHSAI